VARFHIVEFMSTPGRQGHTPYSEVIETVIWGLEQLGHSVTFAINRADPAARNIVFGGQAMPEDAQAELPADTIFYHLEQIKGLDASRFRAEVKAIAARFRIWDYSIFNIEAWRTLNLKYPVRLVPIGYAPVLSRIQKPALQDIDVLFYAKVDDHRLAAFTALARRGLRVAFVCNIFGTSRDELISRSKIVANVSASSTKAIFEVARVSYLMANRKAVIAPIEPRTSIEAEFLAGIVGVEPPEFAGAAVELVNDDKKRVALEEAGFELIRRYDIKSILAEALDKSPSA
jgi:hypothetical protein